MLFYQLKTTIKQGVNHVDPHLNLHIDAGVAVPWTHRPTVNEPLEPSRVFSVTVVAEGGSLSGDEHVPSALLNRESPIGLRGGGGFVLLLTSQCQHGWSACGQFRGDLALAIDQHLYG